MRRKFHVKGTAGFVGAGVVLIRLIEDVQELSVHGVVAVLTEAVARTEVEGRKAGNTGGFIRAVAVRPRCRLRTGLRVRRQNAAEEFVVRLQAVAGKESRGAGFIS